MEKTKSTIWTRNFICIMVINALLNLSNWCVNPLVSTYAQHLGASAVIMGLLTGLFFGIALAMRPVAGPAMTNLDHKYLLIVVFALCGLVNFGYAAFHNITAFVVFRFFHGVAYSLVGSLCLVIAGDALPADKMASGMGVYGVGSSIMSAVGPYVGLWLFDLGEGLIDTDFGFTLDFLAAGTALILALIPAFLLIRQPKAEKTEERGKWYSNIFTVKALPMTAIMMLCVLGNATFNAYMVPFSKEVGIENIGMFFTVMALCMLAIRPISGKLTDRFGYKVIMIPAIALFAVSFIILGTAKTLAQVLVAAVIAAVGYGAAQPSLMGMALQCVPIAKRGVASNTLYIGMDSGYFLGPFLGGALYSVSNYATMYTLITVPVAVGLVLFIVLWPVYAKASAEARRADLESQRS